MYWNEADAVYTDEDGFILHPEDVAFAYLAAEPDSCPWIDRSAVIFIADPKRLVNYVITNVWFSAFRTVDPTQLYFHTIAMHEYGHALGLNDYGPEGNRYPAMGDYDYLNAAEKPEACEIAMLRQGYKDAHVIAYIGAFAASQGAEGRKVEWRTLHEENTARFVVQRATSWIGPFSTVAEVLPGQSTYVVNNLPGSGDIHRLLEIELDGDTLVHVVDSLGVGLAPAAPDGELANPDSVQMEQRLENPPVHGTDGIEPAWEWLCIAPAAWVDEVEPLAHFWSSS